MFRRFCSFVLASTLLAVSLFAVMAPVSAQAAVIETAPINSLQSIERLPSATTIAPWDTTTTLSAFTTTTSRPIATTRAGGVPVTLETRVLYTTTTAATTTTTTTTTTTVSSSISTTPTTAISRPYIVPLLKIDEIWPSEYYGRTLLAQSDDPRLLRMYEYIEEAVFNYKTVIGFPDVFSDWKYNRYVLGDVTAEDVLMVARYFIDDHPEVFWFRNDFTIKSIGIMGASIYYLEYELPAPVEEIERLRAQLEDRVDEMMWGITAEMSPEQREKLIIKRLCASATYDRSKEAPHSRDILGVMLYGTGVCESYSRAFQLLMYRCGIQCISVYGSANGPHIWNMVNINGTWRIVDPTNVDGPNGIRYQYFNFWYQQMTGLGYTEIWTGYMYYPLPGYYESWQ